MKTYLNRGVLIMRKRDLDIIKSLEKFKCLTRSQLEALHFNQNANPTVTANRVLKRLRDTSYITANTDRSFQEYIYFTNPSTLKNNSQKIDHFLQIAHSYIDMRKYSPVKEFIIESKINNAAFIPDVYADWLNRKWFIECQNSVYSVKQLYSKLDKYREYYESGYYEELVGEGNQFPNVLIIGKLNLSFNPTDYQFTVRQVKNISDLKKAIEQAKRQQYEEFKKLNGIKSSGSMKLKGAWG
jgi:hypothetical protein